MAFLGENLSENGFWGEKLSMAFLDQTLFPAPFCVRNPPPPPFPGPTLPPALILPPSNPLILPPSNLPAPFFHPPSFPAPHFGVFHPLFSPQTPQTFIFGPPRIGVGGSRCSSSASLRCGRGRAARMASRRARSASRPRYGGGGFGVLPGGFGVSDVI